MKGPAGRFETLDAMRGVAAVLVLLGHLAFITPTINVNSQLAVDFFFVLSGFVIAKAYGRKLTAGLSVSGFLNERLIRLYPLFFLGLVFAVAKEIGDIAFHQPVMLTPLVLLRSVTLEAAMLPTWVPGRSTIFPLNPPAWSLFFEMAINIGFAFAALHLTTRRLVATVLLMGLGVLAATISKGTIDSGFTWSSLWVGLARVGFSFPLGVLIQRLSGSMSRRTSYWFLFPILALGVAICLPAPAGLRGVFDAAFVLAVSPTLLIIGAMLEPPAVLRRACQWFGDLSYPLYVTHYPLAFMMAFAARKAGLSPWVSVAAIMVSLPCFAYVLSKSYDAPVREWLARRTPKRDLAAGAQVAL